MSLLVIVHRKVRRLHIHNHLSHPNFHRGPEWYHIEHKDLGEPCVVVVGPDQVELLHALRLYAISCCSRARVMIARAMYVVLCLFTGNVS